MTLKNIYLDQFVKVVERAAYGASKFRGKNDKISADQAAVDEMRKVLNEINMKGKIVIGEGEMDEAPMLYINEKVGTQNGEEFDIAVDPLEGTNFTAKNLPNALSVLAITERGNLLKAPDMYMEKIAIGEGFPDKLLDLDFSIEKNIKLLADAKNTTIDNLVACIMDRPRHKTIIDKLNEMNVKINFISDGDVSGVLEVASINKKADIFLGTGGAPEGVLAAAALACLNCQMQTRLVFEDEEQKVRAKKLGIEDYNKKYDIKDMIKGDVIFCATGVTDGDILKGIKDSKDSFLSETFVLHRNTNINKIFKNKILK